MLLAAVDGKAVSRAGPLRDLVSSRLSVAGRNQTWGANKCPTGGVKVQSCDGRIDGMRIDALLPGDPGITAP